MRKLARGGYSVQAEVDLHGMSLEEARPRLADFISYNAMQGNLCLRIVHGKGLGSGDLLRLFHFEGPDYLPSSHVTHDATGRRVGAWVLLPGSPPPASAQTWRLRRWQLYRKPRVVPQLKVWMREYDRLQHHSVEITWPVRRQLKAWREAGDLAD